MSFFLFDLAKQLQSVLPTRLYRKLIWQIPYYIALSTLEIAGLALLYPLLTLLAKPQSFKDNLLLDWLYKLLNIVEPTKFAVVLAVIIVGFFLLRNLIIYILSEVQANLGFELGAELAILQYHNYLHLPYPLFHEKNIGIMVRGAAQVPYDIVPFLLIPFIGMIGEFALLFVLIIGVIVVDISALSLIVIIPPFLLFYNKVYKKQLEKVNELRNKRSDETYRLAHQSLEAFRDILIYDKLNFFEPFFRNSLAKLGQVQARAYLINGFFPKIVESLMVIAILVLLTGGWLLNHSLVELSSFLLLFVLVAYRILPSLNKIILYFNYIKSSRSLLNYLQVTDEREADSNEIKSSTYPVADLAFKTSIHLDNIYFTYPGTDKVILQGISITIPKGKTIGIVGPSGGGKTTLLMVLTRLYQEQRGGLFVDEVKVEAYNKAAWYKLLGYVPQNTTLLDGTLEENIAFGIPKHQVDKIRLQEVVQLAQLESFVLGLPLGLQTQVGEKGLKISGGQRQRLSIARALYHSQDLLLFDEATSALDDETEFQLTESIRTLADRHFTMVIVAHRITSLRYCDAIYHLAAGKITGPYSYTQLMKNSLLRG